MAKTFSRDFDIFSSYLLQALREMDLTPEQELVLIKYLNLATSEITGKTADILPFPKTNQ